MVDNRSASFLSKKRSLKRFIKKLLKKHLTGKATSGTIARPKFTLGVFAHP